VLVRGRIRVDLDVKHGDESAHNVIHELVEVCREVILASKLARGCGDLRLEANSETVVQDIGSRDSQYSRVVAKVQLQSQTRATTCIQETQRQPSGPGCDVLLGSHSPVHLVYQLDVIE
jgi:hypothetical protein